MTEEIEFDWKIENWAIPPRLPLAALRSNPNIRICEFVGLRMPRYADRNYLKRAWYIYDPENWWMPVFARDLWYREIYDHWMDYEWRLRDDMTPRYRQNMDELGDLGGAHLVIPGYPGSGKSILAQMVITRMVSSIPHVIFNSSQLENITGDRDEDALGIIIDEGNTKTSDGSANILVHQENLRKTTRKGLLWSIQVDVNANPRAYGEDVALVLKPCGIDFNTGMSILGKDTRGLANFQACRFAMYRGGAFLGFAVLQRKHRPDDLVYYHGELSTWSTYASRARFYSIENTRTAGAEGAIDYDSQTKHILALKTQIEEQYLKKGRTMPKDVICRRLYRRAKLPEKTVSYMTEVIQCAKEELEFEEEERRGRAGNIPLADINAEGWGWLRTAYRKWGEEAHAL